MAVDHNFCDFSGDCHAIGCCLDHTEPTVSLQHHRHSFASDSVGCSSRLSRVDHRTAKTARERTGQESLSTQRFEKAPRNRDSRIDIEKRVNTTSMGLKMTTNPGICPKGNTKGNRNL